MHLSVSQLEREKVRFDITYPPERIDLSGTKFRQVTGLRVTGIAELAGGSEEIRVHGHITGELEGECDRCLEVALLAVDSDFDLYYRPAATASVAPEMEIDEGESEIGYYEGDGVEIADVAREQVLLWLPMQWVCQADCKGICPICGQNRNRAPCNCQQQAVDDRWSVLRHYHPEAK